MGSAAEARADASESVLLIRAARGPEFFANTEAFLRDH
jgi:hypothetical protein